MSEQVRAARVRYGEAPYWVRAWRKLHRAGGLVGLHPLPDPRHWLQRHGYVDRWPW